VSTLADQVGACTTALQRLCALIERHVLAAERLHGDDMTVPILASGRTVKGHKNPKAPRYSRERPPISGLHHQLWRNTAMDGSLTLRGYPGEIARLPCLS